MATIQAVHIYLRIQDPSTDWIQALSIPRGDIERLTLCPLKWLRFVAFTICGAKGDLSATQGGDTVDYEGVSFDNLTENYYYTPDGSYHPVDYLAFDDRCTSSALTARRSNFRQNILARDESCVITRGAPGLCDAAHIIPYSKGSAYITYVVHDRSSLYEESPFEDDVDINCIQNGILLRSDLHREFGTAGIVFLKTPNFAMAPTDVPRVGGGPIQHNRTTLQYIVPPMGDDYALPRDVRANWSRDELPPPSSILLDFMYGAAIVKRWKSDRLHDMLEKRFKDDFSRILAENPKPSTPEDDEDEVEPDDDPNNHDWEPRGKQKGRKTLSSDASAGLLKAMDDVLRLSMLLKGTTPRSMAAELEKRNKEKEQRSQQDSAAKVRQWLDSGVSTCPLTLP